MLFNYQIENFNDNILKKLKSNNLKLKQVLNTKKSNNKSNYNESTKSNDDNVKPYEFINKDLFYIDLDLADDNINSN